MLYLGVATTWIGDGSFNSDCIGWKPAYLQVLPNGRCTATNHVRALAEGAVGRFVR